MTSPSHVETILDGYLSASRHEIRRPYGQSSDEIAETIYESKLDAIRNILENKFFSKYEVDLPDFHLVYSTDRRSELADISGSYCLIYDAYLGQSFNMLNRLLTTIKKPEAALMYLSKLFAEGLQKIDRPHASIKFARAYNFLKQQQDAFLNDSSQAKALKLRAELTQLQEVAVIAHEFGHRLYAEAPSFEEEYHEFLNSLVSKESYQADEVMAKYYLDRVQHSEIQLLTRPQAALEFKTMDLDKDAVLCEEIICDCFAATVCVSYVSQTSLNIEGLIQAILLSSIHLATLDAVTVVCQRFALDGAFENIEAGFNKNLQARLAIARLLCLKFYEFLGNDGSHLTPSACIMDIVLSYERKILAPMNYAIRNFCERREDYLNENENLVDYGDINEEIDAVLGNSSSPNVIDFSSDYPRPRL